MKLLVQYPGLDYGVARSLSIYPDHVEVRRTNGGEDVIAAMWLRHVEGVSLRTVAGVTFLDVLGRDGGVLTMPMRDARDAVAAKNILQAMVREEQSELHAI